MKLDLSRLGRADQIVGVSAIALFIFLFFFDWSGVTISGTLPAGAVSTGTSSTGWHTFTNSRWLWLLTIIVALASVLMVAAQREWESTVAPGAIVAGLGALSSLFILYRIIHHATTSVSLAGVTLTYGIKIGIWLGLLSALGVTYGGYLQMRREGASIRHPRAGSSGTGSSSAFTGLTASGGAGSAAGKPSQTPAAPGPPSSDTAPRPPVAPSDPPGLGSDPDQKRPPAQEG